MLKTIVWWLSMSGGISLALRGPKGIANRAQSSALCSACLALKGQQKDLRSEMFTSAGAPYASPVLWKCWQDPARIFGSCHLTFLPTLDQTQVWALLREPFLTLVSCWRGEQS